MVLLTDPGKDVQTFFSRHFEIEENQGRKREGLSVTELAGAGEIGDGFEAIFGDDDGVEDSCGLERSLHEEDIVFAVVNEEDGVMGGHLLF